MLGLDPKMRVYVRTGFTDGRLGFEGLRGIALKVVGLNPRNGHLFVFCNASRNRAKFLWYHDGGFYVASKRMDRGTLDWPRTDAGAAQMNMRQLEALLKGVEFTRPNGGVRK
jgi:transposase